MKHNLQFERILFELNRGHHIILSDDENRYNILFSATEAINKTTLATHFDTTTNSDTQAFTNRFMSETACNDSELDDAVLDIIDFVVTSNITPMESSNTASNNKHLMTFNSFGNVGIGTTSPEYALHINGTLAISALSA